MHALDLLGHLSNIQMQFVGMRNIAPESSSSMFPWGECSGLYGLRAMAPGGLPVQAHLPPPPTPVLWQTAPIDHSISS